MEMGIVTEKSAADEIAAALAQVQQVFSVYEMPIHAGFCACCHDKADMTRILNTPADDLTGEELNGLVWHAYWTGISWPELAYYAPRLLAELAQESTNPVEADMLFHKLLLAAHPELAKPDSQSLIVGTGQPMTADERQAVFAAVTAIFRQQLRLRRCADFSDPGIPEFLTFLAAFDTPIAPVLDWWRASDLPTARTNLCLFLADYTLHTDPTKKFMTLTYGDPRQEKPLPENQAALNALTAPAFVAEYLLANAEIVESCGPDWETGIGAAYNWAVTQIQSGA